jgi:uncharacterized membrane protein
MGFFTDFLIISIFFGPGLAISYGLENPAFRPPAHLFTLLAFECLGVAIVYIILKKLPSDIRFNNKVLDKVVDHVHDTRDGVLKTMENVTGLFRKNFGDLGFYFALAFISFAYGVYIAAAIAYILRVRIRRAMISIASGGAFAIVFWYFLALGYIPFITPTSVFITVTTISAVLMIYGYFRENRIVRMLADEVINRREMVRTKGVELQDELVKDVKMAGKEIKKTHKKSQKEVRKAVAKTKDLTEDIIHKGAEHLSQR